MVLQSLLHERNAGNICETAQVQEITKIQPQMCKTLHIFMLNDQCYAGTTLWLG